MRSSGPAPGLLHITENVIESLLFFFLTNAELLHLAMAEDSKQQSKTADVDVCGGCLMDGRVISQSRARIGGACSHVVDVRTSRSGAIVLEEGSCENSSDLTLCISDCEKGRRRVKERLSINI